ncbi:cobalamin biosynthesis protein [Cognatishimia sp. WU-CL00825]|uniref:cobalamin biosynthesis protein n=1 Tax=Cognatishimia sp. WU-CL00825 TaxID=3127658 RepID=UPI003107260B
MIVAGFGFRQAATLDSLKDALAQIGAVVDAIAVPADKADAACVTELAQTTALPVHRVSAKDMTAITTPTQAQRVIEKRGTGSVAEACALVVAGAESQLIATRQISSDRMATCAVAKRPAKGIAS